jgi:hypothetical protein
MDTTSWWVPLLTAGSALLGVVVTQWFANRRERAAWKRDLEREEARWEREDQAKTFEHRRAAYVEFYESLRTMQDRVYTHASGNPYQDLPELEENWRLDGWEKLQLLELYATPRVSSLANEAYSATSQWGDETQLGNDSPLLLGNRVDRVERLAYLLGNRVDRLAYRRHVEDGGGRRDQACGGLGDGCSQLLAGLPDGLGHTPQVIR